RGFEDAGDEELAAACDHLFAVLALVGNRSPDGTWLADRFVTAAERRLRGPARRSAVRGMAPFVEGLRHLKRGAWDASRRAFDEAAAIFEAGHDTTERMMAASWGVMGDVYRQDLPAMRARLRWFREHLAACGDTLIVA